MKKLKCILIDDEPRNLELLNYYIEKYCPDLQIEAIFSKRAIAEDYLKDESKCSVIDIIFLDLILDQGTGFDLLDQIDYAHLHIIICTAHDEFALKAIQYEVVDYLLKPIEIQDLQQTIVKIKNKQKQEGKQIYDAEAISKFSSNAYEFDKSVIIKNKNAIELVLPKDIVFIEASYSDGAKSAVIMLDESVKPCSLVLSKIEGILDPNIFYRLNRSHIVNLREISKIERGINYVCVMSNGFKLPLPRDKYKSLLMQIEKLFGMSI